MSHLEKFSDPNVTAKGEARARVALTHPETLWFNTGTLCNIECVNCYIDSGPTRITPLFTLVAGVLAVAVVVLRDGIKAIALHGLLSVVWVEALEAVVV